MAILVWAAFIIFIFAMLAIDLGLLHKKNEVVTAKKALRWTGFCCLLALLFNVVVYYLYSNHVFGFGLNPAYPLSGREAALQFFSAWLVEQTLSLDNVFVIAVIFSYFKIPLQYQHRVLFWGIVGALIMRGIVIAMGAALLTHFEWAHYVFGGLLVLAAIKLMTVKEEGFDPQKSLFYKLAVRLYPLKQELDGEKFFTTINGKRAITPLFIVLVLIESTDVLFALDSIPAVFAITRDPFLVFTSNIFAILALRSMYFALAVLINKFRYLKASLLIVLLFVGLKMIFSHIYPLSTELSFAIIVSLIGGGIIGSLLRPETKAAIEKLTPEQGN